MTTRRNLNIIARTNGVGLDRDVDLIHEVALAAGYMVTVSHCRQISFFKQWTQPNSMFDVNIFLERIFPRWLKAAHTNILIPNQERFPERHLPKLAQIDHIFCKSRHAQTIFFAHHSDSQYSGFSSRDLLDDSISRIPNAFLHLAGRSTLKGTELLLRLWEKHPEWPTLTLVQHQKNAPKNVPANVHLRSGYLSESDLRVLMNSHPIHLCPSLSEGWGHYIVEAMTCEALVITTDAPPMNEIVTEQTGILIPHDREEPRHLGTNFYAKEDLLEEAITKVLELPDGACREVGKRARQWFLANDLRFRSRLTELLETRVKPRPFPK